jgi:hypothetical protein
MALFPKIEPCPYLDRFGQIMDGEVCRLCKRQVHDLTDMDDAGRADFLANCGGEACVSLFPARPAMAAAALTATAALVIAAASPMELRQDRPKESPPLKTIPISPEPMLAGIVAFPVHMQQVEPVQKGPEALPPKEPTRGA